MIALMKVLENKSPRETQRDKHAVQMPRTYKSRALRTNNTRTAGFRSEERESDTRHITPLISICKYDLTTFGTTKLKKLFARVTSGHELAKPGRTSIE